MMGVAVGIVVISLTFLIHQLAFQLDQSISRRRVEIIVKRLVADQQMASIAAVRLQAFANLNEGDAIKHTVIALFALANC